MLAVLVFFLIAALYAIIQFNGVDDIENDCLVSGFNEVLKKDKSIVLYKTYDFSKLFNCKSWDKVIIVGGRRANRTAIFLKEGVALPKIDYIHRAQGCLLFYFIKDGELISPPIEFWRTKFLYFENLNGFDYVALDKQDAIFKCVKLKTIGVPYDILTFELLSKANQY